MRQPVAYLRRSRVSAEKPGTLSHEAQLAAVHELAGRHGDADRLVILEDWGKSGSAERAHLRGQYQKLRQMIATDEVSAVYGYSMSRLTRSLRDFIGLAELCRDHSSVIRTHAEGTLDYTTTSGKLQQQILAAVAEAERDWAMERNRDALRVRQERGDIIGRAPYGKRLVRGRLIDDPAEPLDALSAAFTEAGSFLGAVKLLNARDIPSRLGKPWGVRALARILRREAPELVPLNGRRGQRTRGTHRLSGLLVCPCGRMMTSMPTAWGVTFYCKTAHADARHPRPYSVAERKLLPAVEAEAARLRTPDRIKVAEASATERRELEARRARVLDMREAGQIDRAETDHRLESILAALERLSEAERIVAVPSIEWSWPPAELNAVLRALWERIELGPDLRPVRFAWRVPEWRGT